MGFPRKGRYHERVVRTENYMINAGDDAWEDIVVNKHYFFPESCSQKRGIEGASDKKKGQKRAFNS